MVIYYTQLIYTWNYDFEMSFYHSAKLYFYLRNLLLGVCNSQRL